MFLDGARGLKLFAELLKTISEARNKIVLVSLLKSYCLCLLFKRTDFWD